jgi:hypothetical protein
MSIMHKTGLTGVWDGQYSYPGSYDSTAFTAVILAFGGALSGTVHEVCAYGPSTGQTLTATLRGAQAGDAIRFTKVYDPGAPGYHAPVVYEGVVSEDGTEIEGEWAIPGVWSGRFLMMRANNPPQMAAAVQRETAPVR